MTSRCGKIIQLLLLFGYLKCELQILMIEIQSLLQTQDSNRSHVEKQILLTHQQKPIKVRKKSMQKVVLLCVAVQENMTDGCECFVDLSEGFQSGVPGEMACCINLLTSTFRATAETTVSATADLRSAGRRPAVERAALLRASSDSPVSLGNRLCSSSVLPLASGASAETP